MLWFCNHISIAKNLLIKILFRIILINTLSLIYKSEIQVKFKAGLIGCGRIGSMLSEDKLREKPCTHAESYIKNPNIELIAGTDTDEERLKLFSSKWNVKKIYFDFKKMLDENKFDVVSIATPLETRLEIIEELVKHKVKIILCEKPIASNLKDAEKIVSLCKNAGSLLVVNHSRRFSPDYIKVRDLLNSGIIGKIKTILCNISTSPPNEDDDYRKSGGGILLHDGTHLIDTLRFLLNETDPINIQAQIKFPNNGAKVEQNVQCFMNYSDQINVFLDCSDRDYFHFEIDLQGDKGRITIGNGIHRYYIKAESSYYENFNSLKEKKFPEYKDTPFFSVLTESIVRYLKTGEIPESSGTHALNSFRQIMAIYKAGVTGKTIEYPAKMNSHPFDKIFT